MVQECYILLAIIFSGLVAQIDPQSIDINPGCLETKSSGRICNPITGSGYFHNEFLDRCNKLMADSPSVPRALVCIDPPVGQIQNSGPKCACRVTLTDVKCNDPDGPDGPLGPKFDCSSYCTLNVRDPMNPIKYGLGTIIDRNNANCMPTARNASFNCVCDYDFRK